jgi:hypothetical protein
MTPNRSALTLLLLLFALPPLSAQEETKGVLVAGLPCHFQIYLPIDTALQEIRLMCEVEIRVSSP